MPRSDRRTARGGPAWIRRIASATALALLPGLLTPVAFAAESDPLGEPHQKSPRPAKVSPWTVKTNKKNAAIVARSAAADRAAIKRARQAQQREVTWPVRGEATLALSPAKAAKARPGDLPVTLLSLPPDKGKKPSNTTGKVTVKVLDQNATRKLGIKGVALTVTGPASGAKARLNIDYTTFASAYGADWAGRLQLLQFPACLLDNAAKGKCRTPRTLRSANDRSAATLSSTLSFAPSPSAAPQPMVLALAAGTKSGGGDFKATPLAASSTWEAGGSSGSFTWSYPVRVPPAAAGPTPDLAISYDSGSIDGRTATTNNQGSQIGEGFDLTSSYIERKYGSCDDDGQDDKFDLCWKYENASLVLNGKATELVKDDTSGKWRLKNDDASTVAHSTGADNGDDGDDNIDGKGEYWTVTTGDGTKYVFGLDKLDGAGASDRTNSVWTAPVFGDDTGEPGYSSGSSFSGRDKKQAWRWNLDYVEDTHGNAMSYWYTAELNNYDKLGDDTTGSQYVRGGYLKEIRYGQRKGALFSGSPAASDKVVLSYSERCTASGTGCDSLTEDTRDNWPDVPFDAVCKDGDKCTGNVGPSFFTRKRLTTITTYAWNAAAATPAFEAVDAYNLKQQYLDPGDTGDSADQSLWLDEIKHTGKRGTDLALDPVKFTHVFLPNRVDGAADNILSLDRPRLRTVTSETGAQTIVNYQEADCVAGQTMPKLDENTKRCYPVYWSPNGEKTPILDWFQKYPVSSVSTTDARGGSEAVQHTYEYSGGGAWHYNDDPMTPAKERTWSIWRGFGKVTHLTGDSDSNQLKTVTIYLRGMNGDRVLGADGKTPAADARKAADVTGIKAPKIADSDQYAGFARETVTYNGATEVTGTVNDPWSRKTATQHKSYADTEAYYVRTEATHTRTNITSGITPRDRVRTIFTTYDSYGMASTIEDRGDDAVADDETCTRNDYARNDTVGINSLISRVRVVARTCATPDSDLDLPSDSTRAGDVISDTATAYDSKTYTSTQKPTKGEPQWTGRAKSYGSDSTPSWQKIATTDYDTLGRATAVKDTNDLTIAATTYVPAQAGPLTSTTVSNAKAYTTTTVTDFATGAALKTTDPNIKITESEYDSLGRLTKVWLPNRSKALGKTPNYVYTYNVVSSAMSWVSTGTLKGDGSGYNTSYEFYDSLLRIRQAQTPTPIGGRLVSLTKYDDRGLAVSAQGDIWDNTSEPSSSPVQTEGAQARLQTDTTYDGAGRATNVVTKTNGVTRWSTDTTYTGDTTTTSAPNGGQATATVTNALGQVTERREYANPTPTGTDYTTTGFTYTPAGAQETITGPDKSKWSYTYDLFGRQVSATDPDKGTSVTEYNSLDQIISTTPNKDATQKLLYDYDDLGRRTGMWQVDKSDGNKLAAWTFDELAKGQQDTAVRYDGGATATGKAYTQKITAYDNLYQVTGSQLTLPDNDSLREAGVPKTLTFTTGYRLDGTISQASQPAVAGLASETVSYTYNATGQQLTSKGTTGYLQGASFSPEGDLTQLQLGVQGGDSAKKAYLNWEYEPGTRRLTRSFVTDDVHSYMPQELKFTQDDAGNVKSIFDASTQGGTAKADYQCFTYDGYSRLTESWTPKTADCATTGRTTANLDGAAPYWTTYTYTGGGQRKTETKHAASADSTTTYTYDDTTADTKPHTLDKTTGAVAGSYTYDAAGNTITRPGATAKQTLAWNTEGKLAKTTEGAKETNYLYAADGELLIRRASGDGETILYLGGTEVRLTVKGTTKTLSGTRYYSANGQTVAVRTAVAGTIGTKLSFLAADHHGTSSIALDSSTYAVTKRYTTPFGAPRGTKAINWPDDKAFLGKPADASTGLTHVGAREYDPAIGQFISVDPMLLPDAPQSLNGYSYADNTPVTSSDPTGLCNGPDCPTRNCPSCINTTPGHEPSDEARNDYPGSGSTPSNTGAKGTKGTAETDSTGHTGCMPYDVNCGTQKGPADTINNIGDIPPGTPDYPSALESFLDNSLLGAILQGDWDKILPPDQQCPDGYVCPRDPQIHLRSVGPKWATPFLVARAAQNAKSSLLAARVEMMFLKGIAGKKRSALAGLLEIEGQSSRLLNATSGAHEQAGLIPTVGSASNPVRFKATATGRNARVNDTEYKMLTYVANQLGEASGIRGTLTLHSSQAACSSCTSVVGQFHEQFPNIRLVYTAGRS
ncbi:RHS repeat-associated core domain-containing protein [Streptomyces justiciae]|uniref:RHS repeat-associated core domain-containing protein n=2 Tax=Streptomyces justiciae TaxID=2780140 RepID=A0ABU3M8B1_9ACTN|nr:RHS repeat-associated core domain-containing protein [Streptomyces justiciae]MDT7847770.1 RHS repeat-associated core domain-containing protein [Streptomyces justiciae]